MTSRRLGGVGGCPAKRDRRQGGGRGHDGRIPAGHQNAAMVESETTASTAGFLSENIEGVPENSFGNDASNPTLEGSVHFDNFARTARGAVQGIPIDGGAAATHHVELRCVREKSYRFQLEWQANRRNSHHQLMLRA